MKNLLQAMNSNKLTLLGMAVGVVMGSATTSLALAAIPDSNGQINACYNNVNKALSLTDPAGNCSANSTSLSWNQGQTTAYGHITASIDSHGGGVANGALDINRSRGIANIQFVREASGLYVACITASFEPKNITISGGGSLPENLAVRNTGLNLQDDGWSKPIAKQVCGTSGANAFLESLGTDVWFTLIR